MDYLPIQASSVPAERAFSSAAETDTSRRNRISPVLMEALQMLKFGLHQDAMDFTSDVLTPEADLVTPRPKAILSKFAQSSANENDSEDVMDQVVRAIA
jgi:hypothetical protein